MQLINMMQFKKRILKFKAWDEEHKLLMRLDSIQCIKGELMKRNHIILQFTGLYDKEGTEIYEMDVLLDNINRYVVFWSEPDNGWSYRSLINQSEILHFNNDVAQRLKRFCSYFELIGAERS